MDDFLLINFIKLLHAHYTAEVLSQDEFYKYGLIIC